MAQNVANLGGTYDDCPQVVGKTVEVFSVADFQAELIDPKKENKTPEG